MKTKSNVLYNVMLAISQVLFPLITFPYLVRVLGPTEVGLLNFAESIARYFMLLAALGIPVYGIREIAKHQNDIEKRSQVFFEIFIINAISTLILSVVFFITILLVPKLNAEQPLFLWSILFFSLQLFYFEWFFSGMNQFKFIAARSFIIRFLFIFFVFFLIRSKEDYLKYMQMQVLLSAVIGIINFKYLFSLLKINKHTFLNLNLKQHLKPLYILFLTIFSISVYFSLDTILLGFMADNESVGYYSSALKLVKLIIAVLGAISVAMFPSMINLFHNGEKEKFNELVKKCFYVLVSLSLPLVVIVAGASNEIVNVLFGEKFTRAILPMQITAPLIFIVSMSGIFGFQVLSALAKDKSILISAVIGMLVSIILSLLLVPMFKENGEAVTILLTELSVSLAFVYFSSKFFSLKGYSKIIFQQLVALIPYVAIIVSAKLFIVSLIVRLFVIALFSLAWFVVYHFVIKADGIFKAQLSNILLKYKG